MPRLNEYISVGFCSGYGDGDFRVSCAVEGLSRESFNELKLATLSALNVADDMWRRGNPDGSEEAKMEKPK